MIICKACGQRNPDGEEFCSTCGRYLQWSGEYVENAVEPEPELESEPEPEAPPKPGFWRRVGIALHLAHEPQPVPAEAPVVTVPEPVAREAEPAHEVDPDTIAVPVVGAAGLPAELVEDDTAETWALAAEDEDGAYLTNGTTTQHASLLAGGEESSLLVVEPAQPGWAGPRSPGVPVPVDPSRGAVLRRPTEAPSVDRRTRRPNMLLGPDAPATPNPGDVFCASCAQFNSPTRVFCRRCGEQLPHVEPEVELEYVPISWWRRHTRRDAHIVAVGARPGRWGRASSGGGGSGRTMMIMGRVGAVVVGLGLVFSFVGPVAQPMQNWFKGEYQKVVHKVDVTYAQQFAVGANATTSYRGHSAGLAVDDATNTYWMSLPSRKEHGAGQSLTIGFAEPTQIDKLGILSGAGPSAQTFLGEARPKDILITFGRNGTQIHETLQDIQTFQTLAIHEQTVTSMTVKVLSVYQSPTGNAVAITEIEFFQRQ